ncbi:MAG: HAD family phosphatase [Candidatus Liptonbacteria bacterium]|nr:HAD family phosphatase [Candidatus Liptonbacteria bacterium]
MTIKTVIFDFDGVLIDAEPVNVGAAVKTFEVLNIPLSDEEKAKIPGHPSKVFIPEFLKARGIIDPAVHAEIWEKNLVNYYALWPEIAKLPDGLRAVLSGLRNRNKILAIATTNLRRTVQVFFDKFGFQEFFGPIVTGEDVHRSKPDPEVYILALKQCGVLPAEAIAVEDTDVGVASAKNAGMRCIAIPTPYAGGMDFSSADYKISGIAGMLDLDIWRP